MFLTANFTTNELKCPCCGECKMDKEFMIKLQFTRSNCDFPFKVNSGYRCNKENKKVTKGKRSFGEHTNGTAVDISIKGRYDRYEILWYAMNTHYFRDISVGKTYIHLGKGRDMEGIGVYG